MAHWKYTATRCAIEECERTRVKGWTTCALLAHHARGRALWSDRDYEVHLQDGTVHHITAQNEAAAKSILRERLGLAQMPAGSRICDVSHTTKS